MGQKIVQQLLPALPQMPWPTNPHTTPLGAQTYQVSMRKADDYAYEANPQPLAAALRVLQTGDSQPYAFAGIAYVLITAARADDGSYYQPGLDAALRWIEKAQETAPDNLEINVLEGLVYIHSHRLADARLILDYLTAQDVAHPLLLRAEIAYWAHQKNVPETVRWYEKLMAQTTTGLLRIALNSQLADFYASVEEWAQAIAAYQQSVRVQPEDAVLWHKLSLAYLATNDLDNAAAANQKALSLSNLPAAQETAAAIKSRQTPTSRLRQLFNR